MAENAQKNAAASSAAAVCEVGDCISDEFGFIRKTNAYYFERYFFLRKAGIKLNSF